MEVTDEPDIEARLAARLRGLRAARGLTLEALAERSGVSRSMISLIERGESSPTAHVLNRLAGGLGATLGALLAEEPAQEPSPLARRTAQQVWRDPDTGYLRRALSPAGFPSALELVEVVLPPGTRVAFDGPFRGTPIDQQVFVLEGTIELTLGADRHELQAGDCLAMRVGEVSAFRNPTSAPARYLVALARSGR